MTTPCRIIPFPADRRPQPRPEPPVNPGLELVAWWLGWQAEYLHWLSSVLREKR